MEKISESHASSKGSLDELKRLLQGFDTAMLTTLTPEGLFRARPMAVQAPDDEVDCDLWFVTSLDTAKSEEIAHEHQVGVSCLRPADGAYLSISAIARIRSDPAQIARLFRPAWKIWFPEGPTDPTIGIMEMQVERAEYWNPEGGAVRLVYQMARSLVGGRPAASELPQPKRI